MRSQIEEITRNLDRRLSIHDWWECSPFSGDSTAFCSVNSGGSASGYGATYLIGFAPFGCI